MGLRFPIAAPPLRMADVDSGSCLFPPEASVTQECQVSPFLRKPGSESFCTVFQWTISEPMCVALAKFIRQTDGQTVVTLVKFGARNLRYPQGES